MTEPTMPARVTVAEVQRAAARVYDVPLARISGPPGEGDRLRKHTRPRQRAMYVARTMLGRSYPDLGRRFGGRDHTTVLHAVNHIGHLIKTDADEAAAVQKLQAEFWGQ